MFIRVRAFTAITHSLKDISIIERGTIGLFFNRTLVSNPYLLQSCKNPSLPIDRIIATTVFYWKAWKQD